MSVADTLPQGTHYIHLILLSIKIYYKLNTLLTSMSTTNNNEKNLIVIGVEHIYRKRHFLCLTFDELSKLLYSLKPSERTLYEILCQNNFCKLYFDFDVHIEKSLPFNIHESLLILQNLFHYTISTLTHYPKLKPGSIADHFLVLSASTELKHSYHLVYTNTFIRFESQQSVLKFIMMIFQHCSIFILSHPCHQQFLQLTNIHNENNFHNNFIALQTILNHADLCNCSIPATNITCNHFQKLLYKNSDGFYKCVFNLHIYSNNQQFRLYKATKFGQDNPLSLTSHFPSNRETEQHDIFIDEIINYNFILKHSLLSHTIDNINLLIISYKENKWSLINSNKHHIKDLPTTNYIMSLSTSNMKMLDTNKTETLTATNIINLSDKKNYFENFVSILIKNKYRTYGYVQSCHQGIKNQSLLFYNIGGDFRFCERLQRHHKSNQTCIIIDTITYKYQIKCKDPDCTNFRPPWKEISQFVE